MEKLANLFQYNSEKIQSNIERPVTTLYMPMSVDGKISTIPIDNLDFDKDLPKIDRI